MSEIFKLCQTCSRAFALKALRRHRCDRYRMGPILLPECFQSPDGTAIDPYCVSTQMEREAFDAKRDAALDWRSSGATTKNGIVTVGHGIFKKGDRATITGTSTTRILLAHKHRAGWFARLLRRIFRPLC